MGTSARPKYKAVHAKLPANKKSSNINTLSSGPSAPPVVDPPQDGGDEFGLNDGSSFPDFDIPGRKKKVLNLFSICLQLNAPIEAI
jgi:hypothetical protein